MIAPFSFSAAASPFAALSTGGGSAAAIANSVIVGASRAAEASAAMANEAAQVQTLKASDDHPTQIGVVRKYDDLERRRSSTIGLEPPRSDQRKATSYVRARNSGVNRLLRSSTSSLSSCSNVDSRGLADALALSNSSANEHASAQDVDGDVDPTAVDAVVVEADASKPLSGPSAKNDDADVDTHSATASEDVDLDLDGAADPLDHKWTHMVLKMTAFTEDDPVTSFRFDSQGGGVGRDAANVASIPADKLLDHKDHARVLYSRGRFYLLANSESSSGTFVRLSPVGSSLGDADATAEDLEDRMQWPLAPTTSFRAGKSDFVVAGFDEATQSLELSALSGKLAGEKFVIGRDGAGIGRSAENIIHAGDGELSRKHAAIWFDELTLRFYLVDLNSTNGTFMRLAGPYAEPYRLEIGDDLLIAQTCLTVNRFDFGVHANMGARKHMEDAHAVVQDLCIESLSRLGLHPQSFFAVYDGHGGDEASAFLGDELHHAVIDAFFMKKAELSVLMGASKEEVHAMVQQRLISAFEKTDELFLNSSSRPQAGSTATTVLVAGNVLFVANTGDSRTVLSRKGRASRLSNDHKPSRPDEAQRVRDTGGFVIHGRIMGELAVSRAFGDSPFKTFELVESLTSTGGAQSNGSNTTSAGGSVDSKPRSEYDSQELPVNPNDILKGPLVIATPEVTVTELSDDDEFLLLASDGLYDVLKDQEAVDYVRRKICELGDVQRAAEALVEHAIFQQRSMDNVTAVVVMFKDPKALQASV